MFKPSEIAERIKILAKEKNTKVKDVCKGAGVGEKFVSNMGGSSGSYPQSDKIAKVALFLDVSIDYLLGISEQKKPLANIGRDDEKKDRLISNYEKLNAEGQEKLVGYSDDLVDTNKYVKSNVGADKVGA